MRRITTNLGDSLELKIMDNICRDSMNMTGLDKSKTGHKLPNQSTDAVGRVGPLRPVICIIRFFGIAVLEAHLHQIGASSLRVTVVNYSNLIHRNQVAKGVLTL